MDNLVKAQKDFTAAPKTLETVARDHSVRVLASLRLEIDRDNAATALEERTRGAETWLSIRKRFCT